MTVTEVLKAELIEKELIEVKLYSVDVGLGIRRNLNDLDDVTITSVQDDEVLSYDSASGLWINKNMTEVGLSQLVYNEVPTHIAGGEYSVANKYVSGSLQCFVNGLKIFSTQIIYAPNNKKFTLDFTPDGSDLIEVSYVRQ